MLIRNSNNSEHSCSIYHVPGTILNPIHMFISYIFYLCVSSSGLNSLSGLLGQRKHCPVDQYFPMRLFHSTQHSGDILALRTSNQARCRGLSEAVGICLIHASASPHPPGPFEAVLLNLL